MHTFDITHIVYTHTYTHMYTHIHTHVHTHTYTHTHVHTHMYTHMYAHMYTHHAHTCTHTYTHMYTHTYIHTPCIKPCMYSYRESKGGGGKGEEARRMGMRGYLYIQFIFVHNSVTAISCRCEPLVSMEMIEPI